MSPEGERQSQESRPDAGSGSPLEVRELSGEDAPALAGFLAELPVEDRTFFWQDVTDPAVAERLTGDERRVSRCAVDGDGRIAAFASLRAGSDWSSHVCAVVLVVGPAARRQGLGRALARLMLLDAVQHGFAKVTVDIAADNAAAIEMFQGLGFQPEALLRDQLRNPDDGRLRDLVVLAHMVDERYATMLAAGLDEVA